MHIHRTFPSWGKQLRLAVVLPFLFATTILGATGTGTMQGLDSDPVMLFVGEETFGDFAAYNGPENSRLNFRVAAAGEIVYFGMGRGFRANGTQESFGQYKYRVKSAATGQVVFGPHTININTENLTDLQQAIAGPDALSADGYPTNASSTFTAPASGDYYVEFDQSRDRPRYIGLWDITIVSNGQAQPGRVFSKNWSFRVPEVVPEQPYCSFGAELSTQFYSYTADGFVTRIDFTDSGFQPLSFNLAFNRVGPGTSGDLITDRQSVPFINATDNAAEHLIFLEEPAGDLFPDGVCGIATTDGSLRCTGSNEFCIPVTFSEAGQVDILLDFNQNGIFDEGTDRILVYASEADDLNPCVPWDGLLGDGSTPPEGTLVDIQLSFAQGVQHWSLYDGELMRNGFCVEPIRPACSVNSSTPLYYDDQNIVEEPGTGGAKRQLDGCDCQTDNCRTWTNFEANASNDCVITDNLTTGYGDRNTLNTWWFAFAVRSSQLDIPVTISQVDGPADHCPGEEVEVTLTVNTSNDVSEIRWVGPNGPIPSYDDALVVPIAQSGLYTATVIDDVGCTNSSDYVLVDVNCSLNAQLVSVDCSDNGTDTKPNDDTFTATVLVTGSNSGNYTYNGDDYSYGEIIEIGPFMITGGDVDFTAVDGFYNCCQETITIQAPSPCSDGCAITGVAITSVDCLNEGTPTDPSDDTFTFTMIVNGINGGNVWVDADSGLTGEYGVENTFGPFPINGGDLNFYFQDESDGDCAIAATVQAPATCSDECILAPTVTNILCLDNGTPYDSTDDNYVFDLVVTGDNAPSVAYGVNGNGAYLYGATNTFGPFPISGSEFSFEIVDLGGPGCSLTFTIPTPPSTCSDACGILLGDVLLTCADDDSPDAGKLVVEVLVTNPNPNSMSWVSSTGASGNYGEYAAIGTINQGGGSLAFAISETERQDCQVEGTATSPEIMTVCPEDISTTSFPMTTVTFSSEVAIGAAAGTGEMGTCYLSGQSGTSGLRTDRLSFTPNPTNSLDREVITFYLYGEPGQELTAAAFAQQAEETLNCDNLASVLSPEVANLNGSLPRLPAAIVPTGLVAYGSLTVELGASETFSLVTTSSGSAIETAYTYVGVLADGSTLNIRNSAGGVLPAKVSQEPFEYALSETQLSRWFDDVSTISLLGLPLLEDICSPTSFLVRDTILGTCASAQMIRRFDLSIGDTVLMDVCRQEISIRYAGVSDVVWPRARYRFQCDEEYPTLANGYPSPSYTGYPIVYRDGQATLLDGREIDELMYGYVDSETTDDEGERVLLRRWTVTDACDDVEVEFTQQFLLQGGGQAFFECPISNHYCPIVEEDVMLWGMDELTCTATIILPEPEITGICDSTGWSFTTEVYRITEAGDSLLFRTLEDGDERILTDLPAGDYLLYFTGEHSDDTIEGRYCRFRVADLENPVAVCRTNLNVSLPGNGLIRISTPMIDLGSYDNCQVGEVGLRRRTGGLDTLAFTTVLNFDCNDVGTVIRVDLRVVDAAGNENFCTSNVSILDNTNPFCTGLEPVTVSCADLPDNFSPYDTAQLSALFGSPDVVDNCAAFATELTPTVVGDACSPELVRRAFRAVDQNGNLSRNLFYQEITVTSTLGYSIEFPIDVVAECAADVAAPKLTGGACDSIDVTYVDRELDALPGECQLIERTWTLTSWCEWDGISPATVISREETCSDAPGTVITWVTRTETGAFVDVDNDVQNQAPPADICSGNPAGYLREIVGGGAGRYEYKQMIRIDDATAPTLAITMPDTICALQQACVASFVLNISVPDACSGNDGSLSIEIDLGSDGSDDGDANSFGSITGDYPFYIYNGTLPIGSHRLTLTVTDACNNTSVVERDLTINDCFVPQLFALEDRVYELDLLPESGAEASALVSAAELASCIIPDCSGTLQYSVNRVGEAADVNATSVLLNCDDRYRVSLEVYVWDTANNPFAPQPDGTMGGPNWRMIPIYVRVTDPSNVCTDCQFDDNITINGTIVTRTGEPMEAVVVGRGDGETTQTGRFGTFQLPGARGDRYVLEAEVKNADRRNGLTVLDMLVLRSHLLGVNVITEPYHRVAADINQDGLIDVQDYARLRALIKGNESLYPDTSPWIFINESWDGRGDPIRIIPVENTDNCSDGHNFIGVRIGDLNGSVGGNAGQLVEN